MALLEGWRSGELAIREPDSCLDPFVVTWKFFWDHTEALEAAGLSEQDAHADT